MRESLCTIRKNKLAFIQLQKTSSTKSPGKCPAVKTGTLTSLKEKQYKPKWKAKKYAHYGKELTDAVCCCVAAAANLAT